MKPSLKQVITATAIASIGLLAFAGLGGAVGFRVNTSRSIPLGLYFISDQPTRKGSYVLFCPPQNALVEEAKRRAYLATGLCPGEYGYLMKMVFAVEGDVVAIKDDGVSVNGALLPLSRPLANDKVGRPLGRYTPATFTLGRSKVLLMSNVSGTSFDGRYFGPVNQAQIKAVIVPVLTW